jgi:hypothetical protein
MTWDIGSGGNGGDYAAYYDWDGVPTATSPHAAYPGLQGENTSVYLNGTQLGSTQVGGYGGRAGQSLPVAGNATCAAGNGDVYPCGGDNGNSTLANGTPAEQTFYNGGDGHFNSSYGGSGGSGENPQGMNLPVGAPGRGGGGGTASQTSIVHGHSGRAGADASGGGGGGGSAGPHELFVHCDSGFISFGGCDFHYEHMLNGGNGGRGGDGYVTISGIPVAPQPSPTEIVFDTPGTYTFVPGTLPGNAQVLNIEVWGAGGGGGSVSSLAGENCSGGGGSGSYGRLENFPRPTGSITVVVGAGGASGGISNNPISGGNGGLSRFGTLITAFGGSGSSGDGNSNGCSAGGSAGQTATGATQTISGTNGQSGTAGGPAAAGGVGPQGYGSGGNGGLGGGFNTPATNGSAGRVRITWD